MGDDRVTSLPAAPDMDGAVDPQTTTEQGRPRQRPGTLPLEPLRPVNLPVPLGNLGGSLRAVLDAAQPPSGSPSGVHSSLSPGQFSDALSSGSGAAEAGAAETAGTGAVSLGELAPLAAAAA